MKTLDVIVKTLHNIDPELTLDDLYNKVDRNDPKIFKMIRKKWTDGLFQIESDMMKGLVDRIQPTGFEDISAIAAIGRPGPLGAHADVNYAKGKNTGDCVPLPMEGCEDIFEETYNVPIYQEQLNILTA